MLRRSVLQLASRTSFSRVPLRTTTQIPAYLSSRRAFSVSHENGQNKPNSGSNVPESQSQLPKVIAGSLALGSVFLAAYYYGVLDRYLGTEQQSNREYANAPIDNQETKMSPEENSHDQPSEVGNTITGKSLESSDISSSDADHVKQDIEMQPELNLSDDSIRDEEDKFQPKDEAVLTPENADHVKGGDLPNAQSSMPSDDATSKPAEESFDLKSPEVAPDGEPNKAAEFTPTFTSADQTPGEIETKVAPTEQIPPHDMQEVVQGDETLKSSSLLDDYYLRSNSDDFATSSSNEHEDRSSKIEDLHDAYIAKDGKLVLDFLQAIHAAEERQAELDARTFAKEKRVMKEKYEKELKDARVRELMYAEREAILNKELNKERAKAAAALKSLQEKLEEKLKTELEQKETEVEQRLKEMNDIAKAELAAAIAREKASQIEKMAEANLHINALCMAFYARSEEARQSHSVHKLALGALALEDALSKGLPIQKEIEGLHNHLEGIDKDSLIALVLSSLPEDTKKHGTDTLSQLNHKFDALKGTLRHFSLIPPGGAGVFSHSLAHIGSWLKVKEVDQSGDGIESLINRVENLLAQGKLCEAADTLENGVQGSQAAEVIDDWVKRARNRAITEQALTILQSYATSISLT
ncbi:hypothetical protein CDL12_21736 [Handroanthus impetiginosus]|uniref:MICOS complex subunit MIC60 n=1 Tax=Handroanthus impetiginosus TaxID=429701 RepID=A0A2G9GK80_9LAMI|nr:hypothetical protein CDL12_21736 [Handroanthus impetiginosus]